MKRTQRYDDRVNFKGNSGSVSVGICWHSRARITRWLGDAILIGSAEGEGGALEMDAESQRTAWGVFQA